jgi:hypothetical protein
MFEYGSATPSPLTRSLHPFSVLCFIIMTVENNNLDQTRHESSINTLDSPFNYTYSLDHVYIYKSPGIINSKERKVYKLEQCVNFASLVQLVIKRTACESSNTFSRDGVPFKVFL